VSAIPIVDNSPSSFVHFLPVARIPCADEVALHAVQVRIMLNITQQQCLLVQMKEVDHLF
jgi:hypothetical protein